MTFDDVPDGGAFQFILSEYWHGSYAAKLTYVKHRVDGTPYAICDQDGRHLKVMPHERVTLLDTVSGVGDHTSGA